MVSATILIINESPKSEDAAAPDVGVTMTFTNISPALPTKTLIHAGQAFSQAIDVDQKGGDFSLSFLHPGDTSNPEKVVTTYASTDWTASPTSFPSRDVGIVSAPIMDKNANISTTLLQYFVGGTAAKWFNLMLQSALPSFLASFNSTPHVFPISKDTKVTIEKVILDPADLSVAYASQLPNAVNDGFNYRVVANVKKIGLVMDWPNPDQRYDLDDASVMMYVAVKARQKLSLTVQEIFFTLPGSLMVNSDGQDFPLVAANLLSGPLNSNDWANAAIITDMNKILKEYADKFSLPSPPASTEVPEWVNILAKATSS